MDVPKACVRVVAALLLPAVFSSSVRVSEDEGLRLSTKPAAKALADGTTTTQSTQDNKLTDTMKTGVWVTRYTGPCSRCPNKNIRHQNVTCESPFTVDAMPDSRCVTSQKPGSVITCDCSKEYCVQGNDKYCATQSSLVAFAMQDSTAQASVGNVEELGCFEDAEELSVSGASGSQNDSACMTWSRTDKKCRAGLPFFVTNVDNEGACRSFCLGMALDVWGVTKDNLCRCGATRLIRGLWNSPEPKAGLVFDPATLAPVKTEMGSKPCPLRVYHYTGQLKDYGIPIDLYKFSQVDEMYMDSIVMGRIMTPADELDGGLKKPAASLLQGRAQASSQDSAVLEKALTRKGKKKHERKCWPKSCASGSPWKWRQKNPPDSMTAGWKEYTWIEYAFDDGLDDDRKEVFRAAVSEFAEKTCIRFREKKELGLRDVKVGVFDAKTCSAALGNSWHHHWYWWAGDHKRATVNLGFCNSMRKLGSVLHELGHIVGMSHEQDRPDAFEHFEGHGPFLKATSSNFKVWKESFVTTDKDAYVGSAHVGYVPYSFESIMHYTMYGTVSTGDGRTATVSREEANQMTLPAGQADLTAIRHDELPPVDVNQINDMYQCKKM